MRKPTKYGRLRRRIRALKRALEPFALEAGEWDAAPPRFHPGLTAPRQRRVMFRAKFNIGNLRRADRILKGGWK